MYIIWPLLCLRKLYRNLKNSYFFCSELLHRSMFSVYLYGDVNCGIYWPIDKICVHAIYQTALATKCYILSHSIDVYIQVCGFSMTSGITEFIYMCMCVHIHIYMYTHIFKRTLECLRIFKFIYIYTTFDLKLNVYIWKWNVSWLLNWFKLRFFSILNRRAPRIRLSSDS